MRRAIAFISPSVRGNLIYTSFGDFDLISFDKLTNGLPTILDAVTLDGTITDLTIDTVK